MRQFYLLFCLYGHNYSSCTPPPTPSVQTSSTTLDYQVQAFQIYPTPTPQCPDQIPSLHYPGLSSVSVSDLPHPNPQCPDQIPSLGSATNTLPTPQVRTGGLPNFVEKQSLKKEVATQTEEHLPPFELAPSSTWQIVETCIGELMLGPRGYSLLPLELFQEIVQHIQELKKM